MLASRKIASDVPPIINVGVGEDLTIRELAEVVKFVVGFAGDIVFDSTKPDGTPRKLMNSAFLQAMGWRRAPTTLREGLARAYADFCALISNDAAGSVGAEPR